MSNMLDKQSRSLALHRGLDSGIPGRLHIAIITSTMYVSLLKLSKLHVVDTQT